MTSPVTDHQEKLKGDKLVLRGLKFHGYHGVKPEEKKLGQKFLIDVDAWMDLRVAGNSDNLSDTISYTAIYRQPQGFGFVQYVDPADASDGWRDSASIVKEVVEGASHNLLESVAQLIASTILKNYHQVSAVRVQVGKPHVAVQGPLDYLGVEITRYRSVDTQS